MFFTNKTVDSVLGAFTKAIADLQEVAQQNLELSKSKQIDGLALLAQSKGHADEAIRASLIGNKLVALIEGDIEDDLEATDEGNTVPLSEISQENGAEEVVVH